MNTELTDALQSDTPILSKEKSNSLVTVSIGAIILALSIFPLFIAISTKEYWALFGLIFTAIGLLLLKEGINDWIIYTAIGPTPIKLCPSKGSIGGQLGGSFTLIVPPAQEQFLIKISSTQTRQINREKYEHTLVYEAVALGYISEDPTYGWQIKFCHDLPIGLQPTDPIDSTKRIQWEISCEGIVTTHNKEISFKRSWEIPVIISNERSDINIPEAVLKKFNLKIERERMNQEKLKRSESYELIEEYDQQGRLINSVGYLPYEHKESADPMLLFFAISLLISLVLGAIVFYIPMVMGFQIGLSFFAITFFLTSLLCLKNLFQT